MKKILFSIFLLASSCMLINAQTTYTVVGPSAYFGSNWDGSDANNEMSLHSSGKYYLVKEVTVAANTTIEFKVYKDHSSANAISYDGWTGNATVELSDAGTYNLVFCLESNGTGLDVVTRARITRDFGGSSLWTEEEMLFDNVEYKFYVEKTVNNVSAGSTGAYKALVYHRQTSNPNWYGTAGYSNGDNIAINFPTTGNYGITFVLDPIIKSAPTATLAIEHTIGSTGYSTYSYPHALVAPKEVVVNYITGQNGVNLTTATTNLIPATTTPASAGTGVILVGSPNTSYKFTFTDDAVTLTGNKLSGTGSGTVTVAANDTYVFANNNGVIGFYRAIAGTYDPFKAYLPASEVSSARSFWGIDFNNEPLHIDGIPEAISDGRYYNLQGQIVEHPTKGLYILNGKKVVIK